MYPVPPVTKTSVPPVERDVVELTAVAYDGTPLAHAACLERLESGE